MNWQRVDPENPPKGTCMFAATVWLRPIIGKWYDGAPWGWWCEIPAFTDEQKASDSLGTGRYKDGKPYKEEA